MNILITDIFSIICVVLGIFGAILNLVYLCKLKQFKWWWIKIITMISCLYFSVIFLFSLLGLFPKGMPPELGRPGVILSLSAMLCLSMYLKKKESE